MQPAIWPGVDQLPRFYYDVHDMAYLCDVHSGFFFLIFEFSVFALEAWVAYREQIAPEGDQNNRGYAMVSGIESEKGKKK